MAVCRFLIHFARAASQRYTLTQPPSPPPERKNRGCLWGCLAALAIVILPAIGLTGYGSWLVYHSITSDAGTRAVVNALQKNGVAEAVLGQDIRLVGIGGHAFATLSGWHEQGVYVLYLEGSKGKGIATVTAGVSFAHVHITSAILVGPHGVHYDLLRKTLTEPENSI